MPFTPRSLVNGALLRNFVGKNVSLLVNFPEVVNAGQKLIQGRTTDGQDIRIQLSESLNAPLKNWTEIIGIPAGPDVIRCEEIIVLETDSSAEEFDVDSHNMMIMFLNNCKNFFTYS